MLYDTGMEVHAPDHPIHTWRDFFIHIATITIGLLIAIGLEQTVEWAHHRHMVREARENIRREIAENQKECATDIGYVQADAGRMKGNLEVGRELRAHPHTAGHGGQLRFQLAWSSLSDSAWSSARDSGALTYMPTGEVQIYADAYKQQDLVNTSAIEIFTKQIDLAAILQVEASPGDMNPEEVGAFLREDAIVYGRLTSLVQIVQQLQVQYTGILKS